MKRIVSQKSLSEWSTLNHLSFSWSLLEATRSALNTREHRRKQHSPWYVIQTQLPEDTFSFWCHPATFWILQKSKFTRLSCRTTYAFILLSFRAVNWSKSYHIELDHWSTDIIYNSLKTLRCANTTVFFLFCQTV